MDQKCVLKKFQTLLLASMQANILSQDAQLRYPFLSTAPMQIKKLRSKQVRFEDVVCAAG
eukprot:12413685-Karenia_brevis.AAC.1